jgi:hypothetical protein
MSVPKRIIVSVALCATILAIGWWGWRTFDNSRKSTACNPDKITLQLDERGPTGHMLSQDASIAVDYEFCIPYSDQPLREIHQIDPTITCQNGPSGRIGCTDDEYLCIGNTSLKDARDVLCRLSLLDAIERIEQTFWE